MIIIRLDDRIFMLQNSEKVILIGTEAVLQFIVKNGQQNFANELGRILIMNVLYVANRKKKIIENYAVITFIIIKMLVVTEWIMNGNLQRYATHVMLKLESKKIEIDGNIFLIILYMKFIIIKLTIQKKST